MTAAATIKLYELVEARDILDEFLVEEEGELTPTIAELFDRLEGDLAQKAERVALWMREKQAEIAALKAEEAWLAKKRKARENAIASSKEYFLELLKRLNRTELGTVKAKLCRQSNPEGVVGELPVEQLALLARVHPAAVRVTYELAKKPALELLRAGQVIEGLSIDRGEHLRIR